MINFKELIRDAENDDIGSALSLIGFLTLHLESLNKQPKEQFILDTEIVDYFSKAFRLILENKEPRNALNLHRINSKLKKHETKLRNKSIAMDYALRKPERRDGTAEAIKMEIAEEWSVKIDIIEGCLKQHLKEARLTLVNLDNIKKGSPLQYRTKMDQVLLDIMVRKNLANNASSLKGKKY